MGRPHLPNGLCAAVALRRESETETEQLDLPVGPGLAQDLLQLVARGVDADGERRGGGADRVPGEETVEQPRVGGGEPVLNNTALSPL